MSTIRSTAKIASDLAFTADLGLSWVADENATIGEVNNNFEMLSDGQKLSMFSALVAAVKDSEYDVSYAEEKKNHVQHAFDTTMIVVGEWLKSNAAAERMCENYEIALANLRRSQEWGSYDVFAAVKKLCEAADRTEEYVVEVVIRAHDRNSAYDLAHAIGENDAAGRVQPQTSSLTLRTSEELTLEEVDTY
jgi:hypothetical protein